jgi:hypothetical protein
VLRRYEFLRALHAEGINRFNVYRVPALLESDSPPPIHFPVFLRSEHTGNLRDLLYS